MKKFKMFFDIEKEEQWLNEQLQKGYRCTNISGLGIYTFEKTDKKYVMRLDYQDYLSKKKFKDYKEIYEDFGWSYINGPWGLGTRYWQKENDDQNEIFSDRQSKSNYYKRLMSFSSCFGLLCLFYCNMIYTNSGLYLAEGLWSMEGAMFWKAFLFETPFALLRSLPALMAVLFGCSFYKAYRKYSRLKEQ
ncbi:DUF2812 domain-containing protein [Bacillus amyloliquefaciens]|uniref:DUF2812 domain-containing protein n=1 Tax=Bacillus amyloliquefaciens group TaxID=1938374 RepID=UPI000D667F11|nr:DUF2812 domain-containing protein [Bacillus velezensis]AWK96088.1 hypothetical protein A2I97_02560 [Bacillus velezensis]MDV5129247.1 DUF2812 domain-containing protein [Bacillus velezensis]MEC3770345.1 DUF2812 domain-containing protein [Bacillus velezensis]TWO92160.1 DUF2812 domain-containing protein [Bacillus velezensis]